MSFRSATLLLAPYEATSSFLRGSALGPEAVAAELDSFDSFDPEVGSGLAALGPIGRVDISATEAAEVVLEALRREVSSQLDAHRFPLTLGGEHTVTLGPLRAARERWGRVGVVQLDAHGDLRDSYEGRKLSHACVMRRALELGLPVVGLGIRSLCPEEADRRRSSDVRHLGPREARDRAAVAAAFDDLPPRVYLTVDMDAFDPSSAPGVGTPEAGGLDWSVVSGIIDALCERREVVGADVVELTPRLERARTVRLAARVAVRVLLRSCAARRRPSSPGADDASSAS